MNNDQEIILAKISAVYDKPPFVKMETGQMEMILKCVGLGAYYDKYREYLEPYWYNGRFQNPVESYRIFVGLNSIFEDLLNERKGDEIISLLTELGNYIPGTILSDEARFAADFNKLRQLYNLMGLQIVSMEVDEYSSKFQVEPYLNEGNQIIQSFGMERWLKSKYQDVYEAYESALNSFSSGDLGAAIESCRTALTGIFSKYKGVPFQKAKWMLGMATLTGDFTGTQSADASEMTSIKNEIEAMGKRDIADFFEENLEGSYKKTKAIYSIYSMLSDYGTHRLEGTVEVAKNEDALMMIRMTTDILVWIYQKHGMKFFRGESQMKKKDEIKVCLVGSSGGHLTHLYMLKPFWKDKNRFWVTFNKEDAKSLLEGEKVYPCYFPTNRSIKALIKNTKIAWNVLHKEKPDLIISCGAAVAVPFFYIGKMMGAKLVYIEVFDRIDKPTMTGKMVYPIVDKFVVQWEEQKQVYPKAVNLGSIF